MLKISYMTYVTNPGPVYGQVYILETICIKYSQPEFIYTTRFSHCICSTIVINPV